MPVAAALAALSFLVYLGNLRPMGAYDSLPARLLPLSLLREGNFDLDEFRWLRRRGLPYFLAEGEDGRVFSKYPVLTPVLLLPVAYPLQLWLVRNGVEDEEVAFRVATLVFERVGAALLASLSVALLFAAASRIASLRVALATNLVYAFGTSTWSISSQALWQHGAAELALAGLCWTMVRGPTRGRLLLAGLFAAGGVAARPTMAIFAVLAVWFVARTRRDLLGWFLLFPSLLAPLLLAYNRHATGAPTGGYPLRQALVLPDPLVLPALLLSPNRGLFVYTPVAVLALLAVAGRYRRLLPPWGGPLALGCALYVVPLLFWKKWWAGWTYGPRFFTDILPGLALLSLPAAQGLVTRARMRRAVVALALWGVLVQALGVWCDDGSWNREPVPVQRDPARVWSLRDPQILRAFRSGWHGFDLLPLLRSTWNRESPALLRPLEPPELAHALRATGRSARELLGGCAVELEIEIENLSETAWPAFSDFAFLDVGLLYRWVEKAEATHPLYGQYPVRRGVESGFLPLPKNLGPQKTLRFRKKLRAPSGREGLALELRLVQRLDGRRVVHARRGFSPLRLELPEGCAGALLASPHSPW